MTTILCTAIVVFGIIVIFSVKMGLRYASQLDGLEPKKIREKCPELHSVVRGRNKLPGQERCKLLACHSGPHTIDMNYPGVGWFPYYWTTEPKAIEEPGGFFVREGDHTLYIDENFECFRLKRYGDRSFKFVRHPSGADIADEHKQKTISRLWVRWMKARKRRS